MIAAVGGTSLPTLIVPQQQQRGGNAGAATATRSNTTQGVGGRPGASIVPLGTNTSTMATYPPFSSRSYIGPFLWKSVHKIALACMVAADTDCLKPMPTSSSSSLSSTSAVPTVGAIRTFLATPLSSLLKDTRSAGLPALGSMFYTLSASTTTSVVASSNSVPSSGHHNHHRMETRNRGSSGSHHVSKEAELLSKLVHSLPKDLQASLMECATEEMRRKHGGGGSTTSTLSSHAASPGTARGPATSRGGAVNPSSGAAPNNHNHSTNSPEQHNDSMDTDHSSGQPPTEGLYMTPPTSPSDHETDLHHHHHPSNSSPSTTGSTSLLTVPATVTVYQSTRHPVATSGASSAPNGATNITNSPANHSIVVAPTITIVMAPPHSSTSPYVTSSTSSSSKKSGGSNAAVMSGNFSLGDFGGAGQVLEYITASLSNNNNSGAGCGEFQSPQNNITPPSSSSISGGSDIGGLVLAAAPRSWLALIPTLQRCLVSQNAAPSSQQLVNKPTTLTTSSSVRGKHSSSPSSTLQPQVSQAPLSSAMLLFVHKELVTKANEALSDSTTTTAAATQQRLFSGEDSTTSSSINTMGVPNQVTSVSTSPSCSSESAVGATNKRHHDSSTTTSKHQGVTSVDRPRGVRRG
eukprot:TRINITY_DN27279_c0_g1_i4.p1 TRINITY_DN27279_c0_g1~~TRINITY_DN27279_c0_g1_i4.p1  ORF type:complete len:634 (+),score=97.23 TRINITY_DN27279_c0_g1_i4:317-2218(+)